tara:strand:- start:1020 stop:2201 length:1182 start_codon:yes stop_codon:yes gene_type:complete
MINKIEKYLEYKVKKIFKNKKNLNLHIPYTDNLDKISINNSLIKNDLSTQGQIVKKFELEIKKITKSKYAVATNTGTAALEIALIINKIEKNSEILVPNVNYIASVNSILRFGAIPHIIDSDIESLGIDFEKLKIYTKKNFLKKNNKLINKKTKRIVSAIMPTHVFGYTSNIIKLKKFALENKIKLIEDSTEALGSFYKKTHLGLFGAVGVLSFNGNKMITTAGGGALITNNKNVYKKCLKLVTIGRKKSSKWIYDYDIRGYNYRMPSFNAALGLGQIKKLKKIISLKKKINLSYEKTFKNSEYLIINFQKKNNIYFKWNCWLNFVYLKYNLNITQRNILLKKLNNRNINVRPLWVLLSKVNYLKKFPKMNLYNSTQLEKRIICLPSSPNLLD